MSAPTLATAPAGEVPAVTEFTPRPFPTCAPWCSGEHWAGDTEDEPGVCFARDIEVPLRGREVSAAMSYERSRPDNGRPDTSVTLFLASRDVLDGLSFTDLAEAEVGAYTLLAMLAVARGDQGEADRLHLAALDAAARSEVA